MKDETYEISIVMPCLNEGQTVGACVAQAQQFLKTHNLKGEIILADNGSTDGSPDIAEAQGARVVHISEKGYGSAIRGGFAAAKGDVLIMGDSDGNHDFSTLMPFIEQIREGYDLVVGNRFAGGIEPGAMSSLRRYVGNPFLSFLGRLFFKTPARDFHCGLRAMRRDALEKMDLHTTGMELASEMIIKASLLGLQVTEVPTRQLPNAEGRESHLNPLRDGWRHLRFLLLYSPRWLFFYPGIVMLLLGGLLSIRLFIGPINFGQGKIDVHTLIYAGTFSLVGLNLLSFAAISHVYAMHNHLLPRSSSFSKYYRYFKLEQGIILGSGLLFIGIMIMLFAFYLAFTGRFQEMTNLDTIRIVYSSSLLIITGIQVVFTSFVLSILGLKVNSK